MTPYTDFTYRFPLAGLALALIGMTALQSAGLIAPGALPTNMLGDPRTATGALFVQTYDGGGNPTNDPSWVGRPGSASGGDPAQYYIAIRAAIDPAALTINPADYGLTATSAAESAAVLGVWA